MDRNRLQVLIVTIMTYSPLCITAVVLEQTVPQSGPVCAGDDVLLTCTVTDAIFLQWNNNQETPYTMCSSLDTPTTAGGFTTILTEQVCNDSICSKLVSTATITTGDSDIEATCGNNLLTTSDDMSIIIMISGPPSAPESPQLEFYPLSVNFSWNPPTDDPLCISSYTITITNFTEGNITHTLNTATNTTNMIVQVANFSQGVEYSFSVAGIDGIGRIGENSLVQKFTVDTPQAVSNLTSNVMDDYITITWMPPPPSSRPPVTGYKISHNTTGSVLVDQTSDTTFTVESVAPGVYLFTVLAVNILGDGEEESVKGNIEHTTIASVSPTNSAPATPTSTAMSAPAGTATAIPTDTAPHPADGSTVDMYIIIAAAVGVVIIVLVTVIVTLLILIIARRRSGHYTAKEKSSNSMDDRQAPTYALVERHLTSHPVPPEPMNTSSHFPLTGTGEKAPLVSQPVHTMPSQESQYCDVAMDPPITYRPMPPPPIEEAPEYSRLTGAHKQPQPLPALDDMYSKLNQTQRKPQAPEEPYSQLAGAHKKKALPAPVQGDYAALGASVRKPQISPKTDGQKNPNEIVYAELGKKSENAPIHLPYEMNQVVYSDLRQIQAPSPATTPGQGQMVYAELQTASNGPPPALPPKPCVYSSVQH